jgi:hypothetical protein
LPEFTGKRKDIKMKMAKKPLMRAGQIMVAMLALILYTLPAANALWVGGNIDVHNNTDQMAHDFHIKGKIKSTTEPALLIEIGYVVIGGTAQHFPEFDCKIMPAGGDLWDFEAEWWGLEVPPSSVGHFGLFFDATCRNVWVDLDGWWTDKDGNPIGDWPILGFEVPTHWWDPTDEQVFRLQGDSGENGINTRVMQMDLMYAPPDNAEGLFEMLNAQQSDRIGTWNPVSKVSPDGMDFPADSFFDVFVEIDVDTGAAGGMGGIQPNQLLLARTLVTWDDEPGGRWFFHVHQAHPPQIDIEIDIKPGSFPNSINLKSKGVIPVAILTTMALDATTVMADTVRFGPAEAEPVHWALEDVDGDGDTDMILHFRTQETGIKATDTEAELIGTTQSGMAFVGSDSVNIVGRPKKAPSLNPRRKLTKTWGSIRSKH